MTGLSKTLIKQPNTRKYLKIPAKYQSNLTSIVKIALAKLLAASPSYQSDLSPPPSPVNLSIVQCKDNITAIPCIVFYFICNEVPLMLASITLCMQFQSFSELIRLPSSASLPCYVSLYLSLSLSRYISLYLSRFLSLSNTVCIYVSFL